MNPADTLNTKKKMKKWQKVLLIVLLSLLGLMLAAAIALYAVFSYYYGKVEYVPLDEHNETIIYDVFDETDPPEVIETDPPRTATQTVTDEQGNQLPPITVTLDPPQTTVPVTDDPKVEDDVKQEIDQNVQKEDDKIKVAKNVKNILLIGTDGRTVSDRGRSDTMILLTINENTKKITMTSFMRDIYLYIPTVGKYNRINSSYASGGVPLLLDTIERNFKLEIDQYVRVNFDAFEYIIDTLGGADIELTQEEINFVGLGGKATPGLVHLNGAQALSYCRCRSVPKGDLKYDFARTARQREFLSIMSKKLQGMSIAQMTELLEVFLPHVTTNIKQSEMLSLLTSAPKYLGYKVESARIPIDGSWSNATIRGMSVLRINFDKNIRYLKKIME